MRVNSSKSTEYGVQYAMSDSFFIHKTRELASAIETRQIECPVLC
jgi:hypothetical protein